VARESEASARGLAGYTRWLRESAGLTQQMLAVRAGISIGTLRDLEQGRTTQPHRRALEQLAAALDLGHPQRDLLLAMRAAARPPGAGHDARGEDGTGTGPHEPGAAMRLRLGILGPMVAWRDGSAIALGAARQRAVLGLLALHPAYGVHRDAVVDLLWGDDAPDSAVAIVQSQISQLRRRLEPGRLARNGGILINEAGRYGLHA
jgi:transcriptional regulator with XRE-family HTH domain